MNSTWHFLTIHGFKLLIIAIALGSRFYRWRINQAAKTRPIQPPESAPASTPMQPQKMSTPNVKKPQSKTEGSPWSSGDPFKS
jgi:hypothetical protein